MQQLDRLGKYFNEKERSKLNAQRENRGGGLPEMTKEEIRLSCLENGGYDTPSLNDKLYLHFRGFKKVENLDEYTGCKALWLDSNGLEVIEGLDTLVNLRCLYLSKNLIGNIQGLDKLHQLVTLDISYNRLTKLANLRCCPNLQTLNVSRNALDSADSIASLMECKSLISLDLTCNALTGEPVVDVLVKIPRLANLSINGNEVTKTAQFRKRMIHRVGAQLGYLDRPVDPIERVGAAAWHEGGPEAERAAREKFREDARQAKLQETQVFRAWQEQRRQESLDRMSRGESLYKKLTPEEEAQRQQEADRAAAAERAALGLGVGQLAKAYMNAGGDSNPQAMDIAIEKMSIATADDDHTGERPKVEEIDEEIMEKEQENPPSDETRQGKPEQEQEQEQEQRSDDDDDDDDKGKEQQKEVLSSESRLVSSAEAEVQRAALAERREEEARQALVDESLRIYKQILKGGDALMPAPPPTLSNTWGAAAMPPAPPSTDQPLYWTEDMDMELARNVRSCVFDFERVGSKMQELAKGGHFGLERRGLAAKFTADACRSHWAALDAAQWCEEGPLGDELSKNFKVNVTPDEANGGGHGAQPSFEHLQNMAKRAAPSYLKPPSALPSIGDLNDESESDDDIPKLRERLPLDEDLTALE